MKKVLVTGAGGYIGRHVVKALLDSGNDVYACDLFLNGVDQRAKLIKQSIFSSDKDIFTTLGCPDICIHLAWRDGFVHNSAAHMEDLSGHYTFVKNMIDGGLKHISVLGSMHEVGYWEGAINENTPTNPLSLYGIAKNSLRRSLEIMLANNTEVVFQWLRAYYILGDDLKNNSIFAKILVAAEEGKDVFPFTTGKSKFDFITVYELAMQIAAASTQDNVTGVINCCKGNPVTLAQKVEEFIAEHTLNIKLGYGMYPDRPYDSPGIWGDSSKIDEILKGK